MQPPCSLEPRLIPCEDTHVRNISVPLSRNPEICAAELDGEMCLFNPENAEYLNLNGTGSSIWNLLDAPGELEELICNLQARYAVDAETCRHETEAFVAEALKRGMLAETQPA